MGASIGGIYCAEVSGKLTDVRIDRANLHDGWDATSLVDPTAILIRTAARLRHR